MAESTVSVADVYEHAALIGKDIESMVSEYGEKVIENIMPKIVYVLEQLETLAEKCDTDQQRINDLTMERERLIIHTKRDEAIQRQLHEVILFYMSKKYVILIFFFLRSALIYLDLAFD